MSLESVHVQGRHPHPSRHIHCRWCDAVKQKTADAVVRPAHRQLVFAAVEQWRVSALCRRQDRTSHLVVVRTKVLQGLLHVVLLEPGVADVEPPEAPPLVWLALQGASWVLVPTAGQIKFCLKLGNVVFQLLTEFPATRQDRNMTRNHRIIRTATYLHHPSTGRSKWDSHWYFRAMEIVRIAMYVREIPV